MNFEEINILDRNIKSRDKQIERIKELKENTILYSDDTKETKDTMIKLAGKVISKLEKMSDDDYLKIDFTFMEVDE